jgi:hypothetical protein
MSDSSNIIEITLKPHTVRMITTWCLALAEQGMKFPIEEEHIAFLRRRDMVANDLSDDEVETLFYLAYTWMKETIIGIEEGLMH